MTVVAIENEDEYLQKKYPESQALVAKAINEHNPQKRWAFLYKAHQISPHNPKPIYELMDEVDDYVSATQDDEKLVTEYRNFLQETGFLDGTHRDQFMDEIETRPYAFILHTLSQYYLECGRISVATERLKNLFAAAGYTYPVAAIDLYRCYIMLERFDDAQAFYDSLDWSRVSDRDHAHFEFLHLLAAYKQGHYDQMPAIMNKLNELNEYLLEVIYNHPPQKTIARAMENGNWWEELSETDDTDDDEWTDQDDNAYDCDCGECQAQQEEHTNDPNEGCNCCGPDCTCGDCPQCRGDATTSRDNKPSPFDLDDKKEREKFMSIARAHEIIFDNHYILAQNMSFLDYVARHYQFHLD